MKKNIVIIILSVLLLLSGVYAFVQQGIAREMEKQAEQNAMLARQNESEARRQQALAEKSMQLAQAQEQRAAQALADCQKKK